MQRRRCAAGGRLLHGLLFDNGSDGTLEPKGSLPGFTRLALVDDLSGQAPSLVRRGRARAVLIP